MPVTHRIVSGLCDVDLMDSGKYKTIEHAIYLIKYCKISLLREQ